MKLKTSYFNTGLCISLLKRFWPLYLAWLCLLLAQLPIKVSSYPVDRWFQTSANRVILDGGIHAVWFGMAASVLSVMAMFSHLYSKRDCGLINSLPIRREAAFTTACLTGLLPLLAAAVLAWLAGLLALAGNPYIDTHYIHLWLLTVVLSLLAFYGMAVFCAMLTGNILILPVLFLVLNVAAVTAEMLIGGLLGKLVYGYHYPDFSVLLLSPLAYLEQRLSASSFAYDGSELPQGQYVLHGLDALAVYAAVGVVLMIAALLLYRRRQMETAGDVVAVKPLKPVFRLCAGFYGGLLFAGALLELVFLNRFHGMTAAAICIVLMVIGAALAYYAAEMLMQKSLHVFRRTRATGLVVICLLLSLGALCAELDLFGYEHRLPQRQDILDVEIPGDWHSVDDPEAIDLYLQLHAKILENKAHNEQTPDSSKRMLRLIYRLKDGSRFTRNYAIDSSRDWVDSGSSEMTLAQEINKLAGVKEQLKTPEIPIQRDSILRCLVIYDTYENGSQEDGILSETCDLTPAQALELYRDCLVPDMQDSSLGTSWYYMSQEARELVSNMHIQYTLDDPDSDSDFEEKSGDDFRINVTMDARRTLAWLEENTGLIPVSDSEFYPPSEYDNDVY